ncbi:MAG: SDR family NAD(P)-dependent oxidoreductase [Vicinamibacteraceae bacterium]
MDLQLTNKTALITGSSSGIGASIAHVLASEGVRVVLHGRNLARADGVAGAIRAEGGVVHITLGDLSTDEGARAVAEATRIALGGAPDILVNNAGGGDGEPRSWESATLADWHGAFASNLFSAVRLVKSFAAELKTKSWGRIINIATGWSVSPGTAIPYYGAAKAAMLNTTVSLAQAFAGTGVTVNTVSPGPIHTPAMERVARGLAHQLNWGIDEWKEIEKRFAKDLVPTLTGGIGRVEDIASVVAFLASPLAGFITAAHLRVDGGNIKSIL